jgi:1-acyl-sn-glycerol-3-phosphate acyltransferase
MPRTLFDTPFVTPLLRRASLAWLRRAGWTTEGALPPGAEKAVLIAAPHTSNWDLPYTLMAAFAFRLPVCWVGKASLFRGPFGPLMRWLGGIPVERGAGGFTEATARWLRDAPPPVLLAIAVEGTRGRVAQWKTGFWYIARDAGVPVVLAAMDYGRKCVRLGPAFVPGDDVDADIAAMRRHYVGVRGRNPTQFDGD